MDCEQVRRVMFLYTDNEMDEELLAAFSAHLVRCGPCVASIEHARRLLACIRMRCARQAASEQLRNRILESFPHRSTAVRTQP